MARARWQAERLTGVWPANHWRLTRAGGESLVVTGSDAAVMHLLEALNAYDRLSLHPASECAAVHGVPA